MPPWEKYAAPQQAGPWAKYSAPMPGEAPTPPTGGESFMQGLTDPLYAGAQMMAKVTPDWLRDAAGNAANAITGMVGMEPAPVVSSEDLDRNIAEREAAYQARRGEDAGMDWYRLGGNIVGTAPVAAVTPATIPGAVIGGGVAGALQPVTEGDFATEKAKQVGIGSAGGLAGNLLGRGIARVVSPKTNPDVKALMARGVTPTPGQIMGGGAKAMEEKLTSFPVLGDVIKTGQRRTIEDFNRAVYDEILQPLGMSAPKATGREAVKSIGDQISTAYDDLLSKATFTVDRQFASEIGNLRNLVNGLPPRESAQFGTFLRDRLGTALSPNGKMDGQSFKQLESALSKEAARFSSSTDAYQKSLGDAFNELLSSLRSGLERSNGGGVGERLRDLNTAWAKLVRLERAAGMQGAGEGVFTPAQLSSAVKAADRSARGRAFARGDAMLQNLSDPAKNVIGNVYPDSGTAGRMASLLLAGGAGAINPGAAAAAAIPMLPYTAPGQRLTAALLARRPDLAPQIAEAIRKTLPVAQTGAASAFTQ